MSTRRAGLTPHDIYQRYAPGVVFVRARLLEQVASPFDLFHARESGPPPARGSWSTGAATSSPTTT